MKVVLFEGGKWSTAHVNLSGQQAAVRLRIDGTPDSDNVNVDEATVRVAGVKKPITLREGQNTRGERQFEGSANVGKFEVTLYVSPYKGKHGWFFRVTGAAHEELIADY